MYYMNSKAMLPVKHIRTEIYDYSMSWVAHAGLVKAADGFMFSEGAVWHPGGFFLFSDTPANKIYRVFTDGRVDVCTENSGLSGQPDCWLSDQRGSNGIAITPLNKVLV